MHDVSVRATGRTFIKSNFKNRGEGVRQDKKYASELLLDFLMLQCLRLSLALKSLATEQTKLHSDVNPFPE